MVPEASEAPEYCPFCGARLREDPDALDAHLAEHEACRRRFDDWRDRRLSAGSDAATEYVRRQTLLWRVLTWLVVVLVLGYALLIAQQLLLGVVASGLIYVVSLVARRRLVGA